MTLEDILTRHGIETAPAGHHHSRPGWLQLDCPFCGPKSHSFHLGFNIARKYFHCWRCRGHSIYAVAAALNLPQHEVRALSGMPDTSERAKSSLNARLRQGKLQEPAGRGSLLRIHRDYLRARGLEPKAIQALWHVEGIGLAASLSWRLYIPVLFREERVSWTTRAVGSKAPLRYISAPKDWEVVNIKRLVYGFDYCQHSVVVVEGPVDAWKIGVGAGALFGTAFTPAQVKLLSEVPKRIICFDSSDDAQVEAVDLARQLSCFPGETVNVVLDAKDPGEASERELRRLRRVAGL